MLTPSKYPLSLPLSLLLSAALALGAPACGDDDSDDGTTIADTVEDTVPEVIEQDTAPDCVANPDLPECQSEDVCTACKKDADCGGGDVRCVSNARGEQFCSQRCDYFGTALCPNRFYCRQLGSTPKDFFCYPLDGVCKRDGLDCAPCDDNSQCQDELECIEPLGGLGFCVRTCAGDGTCPYDKMMCGHLDGFEGSLCLPQIGGQVIKKCGAVPLGFCEPCETPGQCATGLCVESDNIGQVCSMPCQSTTDCPNGTFCTQGGCLPPLAYQCQGFLSCLGVECPEGQLCHKGFCIDPP